MPRPVRDRKVNLPPSMSGFKPFGMPNCELTSIKLHFDEYESIKLVDYEGLDQEAAAAQMNISRPTLTRIHNRALKKIATAFVECLAIEIEGGNVSFDKDWYKCKKCFKLINGLANHNPCVNCSTYGSNELTCLSPKKSDE